MQTSEYNTLTMDSGATPLPLDPAKVNFNFSSMADPFFFFNYGAYHNYCHAKHCPYGKPRNGPRPGGSGCGMAMPKSGPGSGMQPPGSQSGSLGSGTVTAGAGFSFKKCNVSF